MTGKKRKGLEARRRRQGYKFVAHWIIGLIFFVALPIISSIRYAFSDVTIGAGNIEVQFRGLQYFQQILWEDVNYLNNVRDSVGRLIYSLPIILTLSIVLAVILNQKFAGRTAARAIFFMPVIISTSGLLGLMTTGDVLGAVTGITSGAEYAYGSIIDFKAILSSLNMPVAITNVIAQYLSRVFNLILDCGVQIILILAGLQSIPASLYEVSKIEGANKWEEFWFITVPMLRHVISLVLIYTMIESCVASPVMVQAFNALHQMQQYSLSSAMLWFYFTIVLAIMGIVIGFYNRFCMKRWE